MRSHLTAGQRALLESELLQRQRQLDHTLAEHNEGLSRAEHARALLDDAGHDAPQREPERQMDLALADRTLQELGQVSEALRRLHGEAYGLCTDCGGEIPFDRLKAEPWALRCIGCATRREQAERRP